MASVVYFMQDGEGGPIKIGTTIHIARRTRELEAIAGRPLRLLLTIPGGPWSESTLHETFGEYRIHPRREWFHPAPALIDFIAKPSEPLFWAAPCRLWAEHQGIHSAFEGMAKRPGHAIPADDQLEQITAITNGKLNRQSWIDHHSRLVPAPSSLLHPAMTLRGVSVQRVCEAIGKGEWQLPDLIFATADPGLDFILDLLIAQIITPNEAMKARDEFRRVYEEDQSTGEASAA
jgi:hypothetical protein